MQTYFCGLWAAMLVAVSSAQGLNLKLSVSLNHHEDPEVNMNVSQLITSKGYPCENHYVNTTDGYILSLQRIPYGKKEKTPSPRPVIFLQHGLLCSSSNWLTNLENESFAYILADAGFDVWLGNNRGNQYSSRHVKLDPKGDDFWAFSWDEMAEYDLPAMVDLALEKSGQSQLYYVGHSEGTMIMFGHLANHPDMAKKIKTFYALAPVTTVGHIKSPIRLLSDLRGIMYDLFGRRDFLPSNKIIDWLSEHMCVLPETKFLCDDILFVLAGFDLKQLNETRLPVYLSHTPSGTSVQNMVHFAQMVASNKFQKYDYGSAQKNMDHYDQPTPPVYPLENVTVPTVLFWSDNDWLADPEDVSALLKKLPNVAQSCRLKEWDHLDFIWAMDARQLVYDKIIAMIKGKGKNLCN